MTIDPLVKDLLAAGVHFGHQKHRWNPKMKRYIFGAKNGIYIIDLQKTAEELKAAADFMRSIAAQGGPVLFVGTKQQAQPIIEQEAKRCGQYYVNLRWLGGFLTNFQTIRKSIQRLKTLQAWREDGTLDAMSKKEAAVKGKELARLEKVLSGIQDMPDLPKAVFVVDVKYEETSIKEARRLGIPIVALVDTNSDPDTVDHVIPGNDDAIRSIKLVTSMLADAILEGTQAYIASKPKEDAKPEPAPEPEAPAPEAEAPVAPAETPAPAAVAAEEEKDVVKVAAGDAKEDSTSK